MFDLAAVPRPLTALKPAVRAYAAQRFVRRRSRYAMLQAAAFIFAAGPSFAQKACVPHLSFTHTKLSETISHQRTWSAVVAVDASSCATKSGRFDVFFVGLLEYGPDVDFTESFTWVPGEVEISVSFSMTEAPSDYRIVNVAPCACRK